METGVEIKKEVKNGFPARLAAFVSENRFYIISLAAVAAFFLVMYFNAFLRSFWMDDIFQIDISVQGSLKEMLDRCLVADNNPPLSHLLTYIWVRIMPYGTVNLKLLNILITCVGVWFCALTGKQLGGERTGYTALALCTVTSSIVTLAAYTFRPYGLLFALGAITVYVFFLGKKSDKKIKYSILYTVCMIALAYTHYLGLAICFVLFVCDIVLMVKKREQIFVILTYIIAAFAFIPWFFAAIDQSVIRASVRTPLQGSLEMITSVPIELVGRLVFWAYIASVVMLTAAAVIKKDERGDNRLLSLCMAYLPLAMFISVYIVCRMTTFSMLYLPRYLIGFVPPMLVTVALGANSLFDLLFSGRSFERILRVTAAAVMLLFCLYTGYITVKASQSSYLEPFEECADRLIQKDDIRDDETYVYITNYESRAGFDYYLTHKGQREGIDTGWFVLDENDLAGKEKVYVVQLHRNLSTSDKEILTNYGFRLRTSEGDLPIFVFTKATEEELAQERLLEEEAEAAAKAAAEDEAKAG